MLGADAVEDAVEPGLHVAEQDMDDGQHSIGVFAAVLDDRVVMEAVGEAVVALQTISDDAGAGLGCAADKAAQICRDSGLAVAAGFVRHLNASDRLTSLDGFIAPLMKPNQTSNLFGSASCFGSG
jgi:hypothetical protein